MSDQQSEQTTGEPQVVERIVYVKKQHRGFAAMSKKKRLELCSKGGRAAHKKGVAHEWTRDQARALGRQGGLKSQEKRRQQREERRLAELARRQQGEQGND